MNPASLEDIITLLKNVINPIELKVGIKSVNIGSEFEANLKTTARSKYGMSLRVKPIKKH